MEKLGFGKATGTQLLSFGPGHNARHRLRLRVASERPHSVDARSLGNCEAASAAQAACGIKPIGLSDMSPLSTSQGVWCLQAQGASSFSPSAWPG